MGRALAPVFDLLTLPGVVAGSILRWLVATVALPAVEDLEGGETLPYPGLVWYTAVPFVVLTGGAISAFAASVGAFGNVAGRGLVTLGTVWLGISLAVHAFPGEGATAALFRHSLETDSAWRWIGSPLAAVSGPMVELRSVWLDLVYGLALFVVVRSLVGWL